MTRIGCFCDLQDYAVVERLGFDSMEPGLPELVDMDETRFRELRAVIGAGRCKPHAFSRLLPLDRCLHADDFDADRWLERFRRGAARAVELGCAMWPFGLGRPRSLPDGAGWDAAREKVDRFILRTADLLAGFGILLVLEPLGPAFSNYIGTVDEAAAFVRRHGHRNIRVMCDLRHMAARGEGFDTLPRNGGLLVHAHIDYPLGERRLFPRAVDGYDYGPYLAALRRAGYSGILTAEAPDYADLEREGRESLAFLRRLTK